MLPITAKEYLEDHYEQSDFDLLELLKAMEPNPVDRQLIEEEIRLAVADLLADTAKPTALKQLASNIAVADFRILRCESVENYWNVQAIRKAATQNAFDEIRASYKPRPKSGSNSKMKKNDTLLEIDGIMLSGLQKSAGSIIKAEAINLASTARFYSCLSDEQKNTVYLGLNSIIDLSNNNESAGSQKSLFGEKAWTELKNLTYMSSKMPPLPEHAVHELQEIEELAISDIKKAYQMCLMARIHYALSPEELFFEVYALILRLLCRGNSILSYEISKNATEGDFVGEVWTPIMTRVFNDRGLQVKWGKYVSRESTSGRKRKVGDEASEVMDSRIGMKVMTKIAGEHFDVINGEFASDMIQPVTFAKAHRRVLREAKIILDNIANAHLISENEIKHTVVPAFQATALDGEVMILKLCAPGLYIAQHIGSVRIPTNVHELKNLRKKCLPRLLFMQTQAMKNASLLECAITKHNSMKNRISTAYRRSPSCDEEDDEDEVHLPWTRGTWSPSNDNSPIIAPPHLS